MVNPTHPSESSESSRPRTEATGPAAVAPAGGTSHALALRRLPVRRWRYVSAVQAARAINAVAR